MIGYKAFEKDMKCRGFQYEVGKEYEMDEKIKLCNKGFHFCIKIADCFSYYSQSDARFAKVEAYGDVEKEDNNSKLVTNKIRILEEIPRSVAVAMSNSGNCNSGICNSGYRNSGHYNSGNRNSGNWNTGICNSGICNSGYRNSGHYNSGNCNSGNCNSGICNSGNGNTGSYNSGNYNSGHRNTGNWNTGNWNTGEWNASSFNNGCFMSAMPMIMMFNKATDWTIGDWWRCKARKVMSRCPINYTGTEWIYASDMTEDEKKAHPEHDTTNGYLKVIEHEADRQAWWDDLSYEDKKEVMSLPNFDADVFFECTGIRVKVEGE